MTIPVIIDADTGIDDAMAIMYAVKHPALDVRAISCVTGNTSLDNVVANTLKILDVAGAGDIPVGAGATRPLLEKARDASYVHGADGMGNLGLPASTRTVDARHAVDLLRDTLRQAEAPLTIIALAPLTNIALLLRMHPDVAAKIARIVFMGGSATVGNATAVAEFNIWHDPEAAHVVLNSGIPLTMYGLDVFNTVGVGPGEIVRLRSVGTGLATALAGLLDFRVEEPHGTQHHPFSLIGDAGAMCAVTSPELMTIEHHPLQVQLTGPARGQTIVDRRARRGEDAIHGSAEPWPEADVVLAADVPATMSLFLRTLGV